MNAAASTLIRRASCRYIGMRKIVHMRTADSRPITIAPVENAREVNARISRNGCALRSWRRTKTARESSPTSSEIATTGEVHPCSPPTLTPKTRPPKPITELTIESMSMCGRLNSRTFGSFARDSTRAAAITGTVTQKIHSQVATSRMSPATTGLTAGANMTTRPIIPSALPR